MIVNISTEGLHDESYIKIMKELELLRNNQLLHKSEFTRLGTGSVFYSKIDAILSSFKNNRFLLLPTQFLLMAIRRYLIRRGKILVPYTNHVWTCDTIVGSTLPAPPRHVEYPWAIMNSNLEKPMKILDIGAGVSLFPVYLASKGHEVSVVDNDEILMGRVSPKLAEWAGTKINYKMGNVTKLDFPDNTFDRMFCISVLEHLEEEVIDGQYVNYRKNNLDVRAIGEMLRVVKPNGLVILTLDWSENPHNKRSYKLQDIRERLLQPYWSFLVMDKKPEINWDKLKQAHIEAWKSFQYYSNIEEDGWAIGIVLQKK